MLFILDDLATQLTPAASTAIVTLAIGDDYFTVWNRVARMSWERYAARHGMDVIVVVVPFEPRDARSPAWQKCLILSQSWSALYDRLVWVDADIVINSAAPDILVSSGPPHMVSAALLHDQCSWTERHLLLEKWARCAIPVEQTREFWQAIQQGMYKESNLQPFPGGAMMTTGVVVLSPHHHRALLENVYTRPQTTRAYEQPYLSHAVLSAGLFYQLSPQFNWGLWEASVLHRPELLVRAADGPDIDLTPHLPFIQGQLEKSHFLHFYLMYHVMRRLRIEPIGRASCE